MVTTKSPFGRDNTTCYVSPKLYMPKTLQQMHCREEATLFLLNFDILKK